ncbi:hypothetical protein CYMTET_32372 [Cymbomonas tetramitiformis]|uniref:Uncharacterized protein n=1 Tax=Cymbomonas tetramitiformis TaxID=36881 RepID=A0AAE0FFW4_9CHLO|nr:hypothetical protein CYMTET_32372 [Cymbomonas tetramitiformis]
MQSAVCDVTAMPDTATLRVQSIRTALLAACCHAPLRALSATTFIPMEVRSATESETLVLVAPGHPRAADSASGSPLQVVDGGGGALLGLTLTSPLTPVHLYGVLDNKTSVVALRILSHELHNDILHLRAPHVGLPVLVVLGRAVTRPRAGIG